MSLYSLPVYKVAGIELNWAISSNYPSFDFLSTFFKFFTAIIISIEFVPLYSADSFINLQFLLVLILLLFMFLHFSFMQMQNIMNKCTFSNVVSFVMTSVIIFFNINPCPYIDIDMVNFCSIVLWVMDILHICIYILVFPHLITSSRISIFVCSMEELLEGIMKKLNVNKWINLMVMKGEVIKKQNSLRNGGFTRLETRKSHDYLIICL